MTPKVGIHEMRNKNIWNQSPVHILSMIGQKKAITIATNPTIITTPSYISVLLMSFEILGFRLYRSE